MLLGRLTSPTRAARRAEMQLKLQEILNAMEPLDREILALRHFEELEQRRGCPGPGPLEDRGEQPLHPRAGAAQGDAQGHARVSRELGAEGTGFSCTPADAPTERRWIATHPHRGLDPVDELAEEYSRRRRRGERPTPAEYAARYPEHAARILELFPALELIEGLKPTAGGPRRPARRLGARRGTTSTDGSRSGSATTPCSASWAAAAWGSSTRPSTNRSRAGWR